MRDEVHRDYYVKELTRILDKYYRSICLSKDVIVLFDPYRDLGYYDIAAKLVSSGECRVISSNDNETHYRCYDGIEVTFWYHENGEGAMIKGKKEEILKIYGWTVVVDQASLVVLCGSDECYEIAESFTFQPLVYGVDCDELMCPEEIWRGPTLHIAFLFALGAFKEAESLYDALEKLT